MTRNAYILNAMLCKHAFGRNRSKIIFYSSLECVILTIFCIPFAHLLFSKIVAPNWPFLQNKSWNWSCWMQLWFSGLQKTSPTYLFSYFSIEDQETFSIFSSVILSRKNLTTQVESQRVFECPVELFFRNTEKP